MALINCPKCDSFVSDKAVKCINCGEPIQKKTEYCAECGGSVSSTDNICPRCGYPLKPISGDAPQQLSQPSLQPIIIDRTPSVTVINKRSQGKTVVSIIASIVVILIFIVACNAIIKVAKTPPSKESGGTTNTQGEANDDIFRVGDTAVFNTMKVKATNVEISKGKDFYIPAAGNIYVGVRFEIENISNDDITVSSIFMFSSYVDDVLLSYDLFASSAFGESIDGTIASGKKTIGYYAVQVPENTKSIEIHFNDGIILSSRAIFIFDVPGD